MLEPERADQEAEDDDAKCRELVRPDTTPPALRPERQEEGDRQGAREQKRGEQRGAHSAHFRPSYRTRPTGSMPRSAAMAYEVGNGIRLHLLEHSVSMNLGRLFRDS